MPGSGVWRTPVAGALLLRQPGGRCLLGGLEDVLGVTRRHEDDPADGVISGVPNGVARSSWDEHGAAGRDLELAVSEKERGLAGGQVERLVGVGVHMGQGAGIIRGNAPIIAT